MSVKTDIRVCVGGGRDFTDRDLMWSLLDEVHANHRIALIIEGEQRGADLLAREWAESRGVAVAPYPANWKKYGIYAGGYRNAEMLTDGQPDIVLAFPTGGPGTNNLVKQASRLKIPFKVCTRH